MNPPDLTIPPHLLPADGRFGCGPTKVKPDAVRALAEDGLRLLGTSHRKEPVRALVGRLQDGLRRLFSLPDEYEVVVGNGGATAFWDAAAFCLVEERSLHYVFGEFSAKFARSTAATTWLDGPVRIEAPVGGRPDLVDDDGVDAQALTHNETSTGVSMDIRRTGDALVLVDATSGAGGLPVDVRETDAYYFSLQKGFAAEGGLWVAILSPAALERVSRLTDERYVPPSLDLQIAVDNSRKRQTYNTPAVSTLYLAVWQLEWLLDRGGLKWATADCAAKAGHVYTWAEKSTYATSFVRDPAARSNVVATVDIADEISADEVNRVLRANGVVDTDSYRKLGRNQLRVGLFPAVDLADVEAYTDSVDWVVEHL